MAALLKKRALAEYSQSSTVETVPEVPKPKKLKIIKKPAEVVKESDNLESEINSLECGRSGNENFHTLSRIICRLPTSSANESLLRKKLLSLIHGEKDSALKAKCLIILKLLTINQKDSQTIFDEIVHIISKESSHLVIINGLTISLHFANGQLKDTSAASRLISLSKMLIKNTNVQVKCKCLEILGEFSSLEDPTIVKDNLQLVHAYIHSHDPRIRSVAFRTMLKLHEKGAVVEESIYPEVIKYLNDDNEIVKLAALKMLWTLSQSYPEQMVSSLEATQKIRLIDDAFAKVCQAINDPFVQVRVSAAQLLGKMPQVSQTFLEQTLDKKLMSDMRRKRSAHELQWEKVKAGEWSSGKAWADDAPKEIVDADSVSLITSGAAGAFVHGLEDEFMEVRSVAVDSLCTLALKSNDFANLALDFLVDMFNDEIEEVRLKAIDSLTKISKQICLWEDQLEIILSALEDKAIDIREGLHKLLAVCQLMTKDCVKMCLDNLLENLKKYPQDKKSIWKGLEGLGKNHPWVILPLIPQLLAQHSFFDTPETDPEDPAYVSVLILVLNAAKGCQTMAAHFDQKVFRHYHYLRDTLPQLVPELGQEFFLKGQIEGNTAKSATNGRILLKELIGKLKNAQNLTNDMKLKLSQLILRDLKRISEVDQEVSAVAKFTGLYIRAQIFYTNCTNGSTWAQLSPNSQNDFLKQKIQSFLQLCLKLQYGFSGLSPAEFAIIIQLKLRALAFQLVYIVRGSNASALNLHRNLMEQAEKVQKYLEENGNIQPDAFTLALFNTFDSLDDPKPGTVAKLIFPLFEKYPIPFVSFSSSIKMATATIIDPTGESDNPLKFTAGLLLGIPFDCEFQNLNYLSHVRIRVKYPDQQVHLITPRIIDFRKISSSETRLLTTINASHQAWTEPCPINIGVVLDLSGPETNYNKKLVEKNDPIYTMLLSEEKSVLIYPRPIKKGI